jgi:transcriptional regulator with XRE-family HTH domain
MRHVAPVEPYYRRLRRLRLERGLSQPALFRLVDGVSFDTMRALERDPERGGSGARSRHRRPSADTLERVARGLDVPPEEFPEYRLERARDLLDERVVGLDRALAALESVERALRG